MQLPISLRLRTVEKAQKATMCKTIAEIRSVKCPAAGKGSSKEIEKLYLEFLKNPKRDDINEQLLAKSTYGNLIGLILVYIGKKRRDFPWATVIGTTPETTRGGKNPLEVISVVLNFVKNATWQEGEVEPAQLYATAKHRMQKSGHAAVLLIDHRSKTVEYMDPHGVAAWNYVVWPKVARFLQEQLYPDYTAIPPWETCPIEGMQAVLEVPFCADFASLYAFLRLRCPEIPALDLQIYLSSLGPDALQDLLRGWMCYRLLLIR